MWAEERWFGLSAERVSHAPPRGYSHYRRTKRDSHGTYPKGVKPEVLQSICTVHMSFCKVGFKGQQRALSPQLKGGLQCPACDLGHPGLEGHGIMQGSLLLSAGSTRNAGNAEGCSFPLAFVDGHPGISESSEPLPSASIGGVTMEIGIEEMV